MGKEEFKGVQIYDAIQDHALNYWFSTNEGLFFYDHYSFSKINCTESKSISFFNFVINANGTIFCNNINNQIFTIKNNRCKLFYELDGSEAQADICLTVTPEDYVLVSCKKLILLDEKGEVIKRHDLSRHYIGLPYMTTTNEIIYSLSSTDSIAVYSNKQFSVKSLVYDNPQIKTENVLQFFRIENKTYALNVINKSLFDFDATTYRLTEIQTNDLFKRSPSIRSYTTSSNLWVAGTMPGVAVFDKDISNQTADLFYPNIFVSDVYEDREKNILVSTFDHGIYVIPDMTVRDLIRDYENDPIGVIKPDSEFGLLMGTSTGKLVSYKDGFFKTIRIGGTRPIEVIISDENSPFLIFDDGHIRILTKESGQVVDLVKASLKDGVILNENIIYLSTNSGLIKLEKYSSQKDLWQPEWVHSTKKDMWRIEWIKSLQFRNYAIEYNKAEKNFYVSTVNGLFLFDEAGQTQEIKNGDSSIFASSLCSDKNHIYAPLNQYGILVLENGRVDQKLEPKVKDKPVIIFKMIIYEGTIFAHTDLGLCQFDLDGNFIRSFTNSTEQADLRILDFAIENDQLWISNPNGIQNIDLNYKGLPIPAPTVYISNIFANDSEISIDSLSIFDSATRKFLFVISSPTLKYKSDIRYHYKLEGYDPDWMVNDYYSNEILYNALAPGDYKFMVKAENQGKFSGVVSYSFTIGTPFYLQAWFLISVVLIFLLTVYLIYRRQLKIQRKKAIQMNELNASKLTAIQSQMNPHFIFNSLNSIQDLILKGDVEQSYSYITTFSNLVRRTLNYSDKDFIDFEQELKLLELYLSLEKLRFKKDFSYHIETNEITDVQIPPMLIQPFIENALVHGLLHKEGEKKLKISFKLNDHLICLIEDNGIGRDQAKIIKERQRTDHESFSVQAIRRRFEILSVHFQGELGYTYEDLEENGKPAGTRVRLQIPVRHKY